MSEPLIEVSSLQELKTRVSHLEEVNRSILDALELMVSFGEFQNSINPDQEPAKILSTFRFHLKRLIQFCSLTFLLVNESDFDFQMTDCEPESDWQVMRKELDFQIERGTFAWAVHQNRAVTVPAKYFSQPLILHSMVTRSRVVGMFAGILAVDELSVINISSNLPSMTSMF